MNILKSLIKFLTKEKRQTQPNIVIIPIIPPEEIEEGYDEEEVIICEDCFEELAVKSCPNCGTPLCLDCYVIHVLPFIRKKKEKKAYIRKYSSKTLPFKAGPHYSAENYFCSKVFG